MSIRKRGREGVCSSQFDFNGQTYCFTFNGKDAMPYITDKREARDYEAEIRAKLRAGTFLQHAGASNFARFFEQIFMDYARREKSPLAVQFDEYNGRYLLEEFGKLELNQITTRHIERFLRKMLATKSKKGELFAPVTVRRFRDMLNRVFVLAIQERLVLHNPVQALSRALMKELPTWQPRDRWLGRDDPDEEASLFRALADSGADHLAALARLILHTGIRPPKELLSVEKAHVNLSGDARRVAYQRSGLVLPPRSLAVIKTKEGVPRVLPLNRVAGELLERLCADTATGAYLFAHKNGQPLGSFKKGWRAACERAAIADLRPYDLRRTFATRLHERNVPVLAISALMGHSRHAAGFGGGSHITPGYVQIPFDLLRDAVARLEQPTTAFQTAFGGNSGKSLADEKERRLAG